MRSRSWPLPASREERSGTCWWPTATRWRIASPFWTVRRKWERQRRAGRDSYSTTPIPNNVLPETSKNAAFYFPWIEVIDPAKQLQDQDPARNIPSQAQREDLRPAERARRGHLRSRRRAAGRAQGPRQRGGHRGARRQVLHRQAQARAAESSGRQLHPQLERKHSSLRGPHDRRRQERRVEVRQRPAHVSSS